MGRCTILKMIHINNFDDVASKKALNLAQKAFVKNEVPVGAVCVDQSGKIVGRAYNQVEGKKTQLAHAELELLRKVTKKVGSWRLSEMTMYVTLQPCLMCMGALILSRVKRIVYLAPSPLFGANLDKYEWFGIYKDSLPIIELKENEDSIALLKKFFRKQKIGRASCRERV